MKKNIFVRVYFVVQLRVGRGIVEEVYSRCRSSSLSSVNTRNVYFYSFHFMISLTFASILFHDLFFRLSILCLHSVTLLHFDLGHKAEKRWHSATISGRTCSLVWAARAWGGGCCRCWREREGGGQDAGRRSRWLRGAAMWRLPAADDLLSGRRKLLYHGESSLNILCTRFVPIQKSALRQLSDVPKGAHACQCQIYAEVEEFRVIKIITTIYKFDVPRLRSYYYRFIFLGTIKTIVEVGNLR